MTYWEVEAATDESKLTTHLGKFVRIAPGIAVFKSCTGSGQLSVDFMRLCISSIILLDTETSKTKIWLFFIRI